MSAPLSDSAAWAFLEKQFSLRNAPVVQNTSQDQDIGGRQGIGEEVAAEELQPIIEAA